MKISTSTFMNKGDDDLDQDLEDDDLDEEVGERGLADSATAT
jgi:hypothetical protein